MTDRHFTSIAALAILATASVAGPAHADIVTALTGNPTAVSGGYAYTYEVQLAGGQIDGTTGGTPLQFGTVYDFGTIIGPITTTGDLGLFSWTLQPTSSQALNTNVPDNPGLQNIRFTYNGPNDIEVSGQSYTPSANPGTVMMVTPGNANLGTFTVVSPNNRLNGTTSSYDGQDYKGTNNTLEGNNGALAVPDLPATVPEPATLAILGSALFGAGLLRRRRK